MTNELSEAPAEPVRQFYWKSKYTAFFAFIGFGTIVGCVAIGLYFGSQRQMTLDKESIDNIKKQYEDRLGTQSAQHAAELLRYDDKFDKLAKAVLEQKDALAASTKERRAETKKTQALVQQATAQATVASKKADDLGVKYQQSQKAITVKIDEVASAVKANPEPASQPEPVKPKASPTDKHWWNNLGH